MATYKEIKGTNIEVLASDPSNPVEGQVWFNSTSNELKGQIFIGDSIATGGNYPQSLYQAGSAGTQTAAIGFGGRQAPSRTAVAATYNGTNWTTVNSMNSQRSVFQSSFGTSTSAIGVNGQGPPSPSPAFSTAVEEYNGTNWSEVASTNTKRRIMSGCGATGTSGLVAGGLNDAAANQVLTETWNGSSWTEVNDLNTARSQSVGAGTITAAVAAGGTDSVESWNGTNWTAITASPTALSIGGGTQTSVIANAGSAPDTSVFIYNGSSWATSVATFSTTHPSGSFSGNPGTAALFFAGSPSGTTNATSEFNLGAGSTSVTFTDS
ncbi:hypothetical protein N9308_03110 [Candidatus Pelagibacter sp.]|nr:hypothetical protein [Candidatus Pelagibacter sp.]